MPSTTYRPIAWRLGRPNDRADPWTKTHLTAYPHPDMSEEHGPPPVTLCGVVWPRIDDGRWVLEGGLGFTGVGVCRRCLALARHSQAPKKGTP